MFITCVAIEIWDLVSMLPTIKCMVFHTIVTVFGVCH